MTPPSSKARDAQSEPGSLEQLDLFAPAAEPAEPDGAADPATAADRRARALAQTLFDRPLVVEAGAGTGKTTTLTARLVAWALGPGWERAHRSLVERAGPLGDEPTPTAIAERVLDGTVAITFTEAAAAEMADRVADALERVAADDPPPWLLASALPRPATARRRATLLLPALDRLAVSTIHAFCLRLLGAHPLEAGLHPELAVDPEGRRVEEIAREVVERALGAAYGTPGDRDLLALAAAEIGPPELVEALVGLAQAGAPGELLDADPLAPECIDPLRRELAERVERLAAATAELGGGRMKKALEVVDAVAATRRLIGRDDEDVADAEVLCTGLADAWGGAFERLKEWAKGELTKTTRRALGDRVDEVIAAAAELRPLLEHLLACDPVRLGRVRRGLAPLWRTLAGELRARGIVTFAGLLAETHTLLAGRPRVAATIRRRIDHLLVDELQDTDRRQVEIIAALALDGPADERPSLFAVGDPKQSIYGWRSADLAAYEELVGRIEAAGGERARLAVNFRSVPPVLAEVEAAVGPVMTPEPGVQPPFEPLVACPEQAAAPGFAHGRWRPVEHWLSWGPEGATTSPREARRVEAEALAADLVRLHREAGIPWSAAALLLRTLSDLDEYLEAFRRAGVPFAVVGDRQYYRRREVIDAAALVRAVLDPGDHVALLAVLRSPFVGVPDAALLPLWRRGLPDAATGLLRPSRSRLEAARERVRAAADEVPADVPGIDRVAGWPTSLLAALEDLAHLRHLFATGPADLFVEALRERFLLEPLAAARYLGAYRVANLDRFCRRLIGALDDAEGDPAAVLAWLRRATGAAEEAEEGRPHEAGDDAVQVMTVHQAKGLDFRHVYLMDLHRQPNPSEGTEVRVEDGEYGLLGAATPGYHRVREARRRVEEAERVRLLYVATTRAKERLVLAGLRPATGKRARAGSVVELLARRRGGCVPPEDLAAAAAEAASIGGDPADGGAIDRDGARWILPAVAPEGTDAGVGPRPAEREPLLPTPSAVAADAARLARHRAAAERRMERPVSAAASEEAHERLETLFGEPASPRAAAATASGAAPLERDDAMAVGTIVHRLLETVELGPDAAAPALQLSVARPRLESLLAQRVPAERRPAALGRAEAILDGLAGGRLLGRLAELGAHGAVVARELAILLPPPDGPATAAGEPDEPTADPAASGAPVVGLASAPVGFVAGAIDLLYRDPADGRLVVADYKTDEIGGADPEAELERRAAAYAPQIATYLRAVAEALEPAVPPRGELWFLAADRIVPLRRPG